MTPKDILKLTDLYGEIFWLGIFHILKKNWNLAKLMATEIEKNTWYTAIIKVNWILLGWTFLFHEQINIDVHLDITIAPLKISQK